MAESAAPPTEVSLPPVILLSDPRASLALTGGGKAANLARLVQAGFRVPNGFVVTTDVYDLAVHSLGLATDLTELAGDPDGAARVRTRLEQIDLAAPVRAAITAAYAELGSPAVAVRSSATAEDLPGAAFAGQQETFLDVVGEEALVQAVGSCWASLWSDRAISYRSRQPGDDQLPSIAVVVQTMVPADTAGVTFTANPVTGDRGQLVINAASGLGEAVVSGSVTPEQFVLDRRGRLRSWSPGVAVGEPRADPAAMLLSGDELTALHREATRVADLFGCPQDIEWALHGGTLWLLQARPMTALPPPPPNLNAVQRTVAPFYVEMFQQRPYPLDVSGWLTLGVFDMLTRMAASVGVRFPEVSALLPEEDGVVTQLVPPLPRPTLRVLAAPVSVARRARRYRPEALTHDHRYLALRRQVDVLNQRTRQPLSWPELLDAVDRCFQAMRLLTALRVSYLPAAFVPQLQLRLILLLLGRRSLGSTLLSGAPTRTQETNRALERLAEAVRGDPALRTRFTGTHAPELWHRITTDPELQAVHRDLMGFLDEFGHRETVSITLSSAPTWSAAPETVVGLIQALVAQGMATKIDSSAEADRRLAAHPLMRIRAVHNRVRAVVQATRAGIAVREDTHFYASLPLPPLRRALVGLGQQLVDRGVLADPMAVFHLHLPELQAISDPGNLDEQEVDRLRALVAARTRKRAEVDRFPLLDLSALTRAADADVNALLRGVGASAGTARGPARIITDPSAFGFLRPGDVLVCQYTNPSWTPLFQRAAAVVVDTGGLGSHASIVAREYGIPAVMGTGRGTRTLVDGQRVLVDGTRGLVLDDSDEGAQDEHAQDTVGSGGAS